MSRSFPLWAVALLALSGCSDDGGSMPDTSTVDTVKLPDLGGLPDLSPVTDPCQSEWKDAVSPQSTVSTGAVVTTDKGSGVFETTVDASAGGMNQAHLNPFVYISLDDGSQVDIDDLSARTALTWDLAIRRTVFRINGGDSGAGQGAVAIQSNKTLDQVTAVPASGFATDDFIDANCTIQRDPINNIWTAFSGTTGLWYDYDTQTSKVTPKPDVYVIRRADGTHVKLVIDSYYGATGTSANYTLRWSKL